MLEVRKSPARLSFAALAAGPDHLLALDEAALWIAAEEYPEIDVAQYRERLDEIAAAVYERCAGLDEHTERLAALLRFLHMDYGLRGNREDYYDPRNSFINDVLDRRMGIPISLSIIYLEVARRAGVDLRGVAFPGHFLMEARGPVPLYIDPFQPDSPLTAADCQAMFVRLTGGRRDWEGHFLKAASSREILVRMLTNLKLIYARREEFDKALGAVDRILLLNPKQTAEYRDRAFLHERLENFRLAVADLELYLGRDDATEKDTTSKKLEELQQRLAMFH